MRKQIDSFSCSVDELLADYQQFTIQWYQRGFSWRAQHVEEFVRDLTILAQNQNSNDDAVHFLGTIIVAEGTSSGPRDKNRDLIDGQQRLTTITLTLLAIRDYVEKRVLPKLQRSESALVADATAEVQSLEGHLEFTRDGQRHPRMLLLGADGQALAKLIERKTDVVGDLKGAYDSILKHLLVKRFNSSKDPIAPESQLQSCQALKRALCKGMQVNVVSARDAATASDLFLVVNSRGKPLTQANLLKTQAMRLARAFSGPSKTNTDEAWSGINQLDSGARANAVPSRDFLNHFYNSHVGRRATSHTLIAEFTKNVMGFDETLGLQPAEASWDTVHNSAKKALDLFEWSRKKPAPSTIPSQWPDKHRAVTEWGRDRFLRLFHLLDAKACLPLMMAALEHLDERTLVTLGFATELAHFRYQMIGGEPNALSNLFIEHAKKIRLDRDNWSVEGFVSQVRPLMQYEAPNEVDLVFTAGIQSRLKYSSAKSSIVYYFFTAIAQYDPSRDELDVTSILPVNHNSASDIEHIRAQADSVNGDLDDDQLHSVGNLTLWESTPNRKAQESPFSEKRAGYLESKFAITRELGELSEWKLRDVVARTARLGELGSRLFRPERALSARI